MPALVERLVVSGTVFGARAVYESAVADRSLQDVRALPDSVNTPQLDISSSLSRNSLA